jgi:hypothetical protein
MWVKVAISSHTAIIARKPDQKALLPLVAFHKAAPKATIAIIHQGMNNCSTKLSRAITRNNRRRAGISGRFEIS